LAATLSRFFAATPAPCAAAKLYHTHMGENVILQHAVALLASPAKAKLTGCVSLLGRLPEPVRSAGVVLLDAPALGQAARRPDEGRYTDLLCQKERLRRRRAQAKMLPEHASAQDRALHS
jgi:hypothetical protein